MARIRTIKPEFFTSEDIVSLSPLSRLFYVSLWCEADREGRMEWKPKTFKLRYFPGDQCDIEQMSQELVQQGLVVLYVVDGKTYAEIPSFKRHQVINNRESASEIPENDGSCIDASGTRESGVKAEGKEGREGKGRKEHNNTSVLFVASDADDQADDACKPAKPNCPHKEIIALYHELLPASPEIRDWTPARADTLRVRWNEAPERQNLDWWRRFFTYIAESAFLTGRTHAHDRKPFCAPLEWILKAENFAKIREGRYHQEAA